MSDDIVGSAIRVGAWCGDGSRHEPHGLCLGMVGCGETYVHPPHLGCEGVTAPMPPAPRPIVVRPLSCQRCDTADSTVAWRYLWNVETRAYPLCDDCNDVVQGPDHIDVTTSNRAPQ